MHRRRHACVGVCSNGNLRTCARTTHDSRSIRLRNNSHARAYTYTLRKDVRVCACVCMRACGRASRSKEESKTWGERREGLRRGGVQGQERRDKERTDETTGAGEKEITAGSDRVVEINVARLIGATEECACGLSGSQLERLAAFVQR